MFLGWSADFATVATVRRMDNPWRPLILPRMTGQTDITIIGGGLTGPLLALALAKSGFSVCVIDQIAEKVRSNAGFDGRAYAVALSSCRLLTALDLWEDLAPNAQPILDIKVTDGHAGQGPSPFFMHFDHAELEEGPMGHMIEDRHLRRALLDRLAADPRIQTLEKVSVTSQTIAENGITVGLNDGTNIASTVVVGADGRGSGTAKRAGISRTGWGYGQSALVCAIEHKRPHSGVAHQFFMPPGPLAILPLKGNRSAIVWSENKEQAAAIHALPDADYIRVLQPRFGSFLGNITLAGKRWTYPLSLSLAHNLVADRVALVGDSAHGVHPIAGQGLNAGMRDIAALAQILAEAKARGEDVGSEVVLKRYEEWRRFDNTALALATDTFNRLFSNDNPLLRFGRDVGMGVVQAIPALRRGFMREAAGLTGDIPKLMQ